MYVYFSCSYFCVDLLVSVEEITEPIVTHNCSMAIFSIVLGLFIAPKFRLHKPWNILGDGKKDFPIIMTDFSADMSYCH